MTPKFDQLSEGFLSGLGKTISSAANMAQKAYNFPGKAIGALNKVVQQGDISPITGAAKAVGDKLQGRKPGDQPSDMSQQLPPLKAGDKVRFYDDTVFKNMPTGVEAKLDQPQKFQGGNLYNATIKNHPKIGSIKVYDNPNESLGNMRRVHYFDKSGAPITNDTSLTKFLYVGPNPDASQKEYVFSDNETRLIPGASQQKV